MKGELTKREHVIGWSSLAVLIAIFLPWETVAGISTYLDGWKMGLVGWGGGVLLFAAGEYLVARRLGYRIWAPPFGDAWLAAVLCATGLLLVIVRWATLPSDPTFKTGSSYGLWLAVAAGVVETVAVFDEARAR